MEYPKGQLQNGSKAAFSLDERGQGCSLPIKLGILELELCSHRSQQPGKVKENCWKLGLVHLIFQFLGIKTIRFHRKWWGLGGKKNSNTGHKQLRELQGDLGGKKTEPRAEIPQKSRWIMSFDLLWNSWDWELPAGGRGHPWGRSSARRTFARRRRICTCQTRSCRAGSNPQPFSWEKEGGKHPQKVNSCKD